jgi:outer membrane receptor protein involved in Fe transport
MFYARAKEYAAYFQDKYRVSSRLTINAGLRYEYWPPFRSKNDAVASFDRANHAIVLGTPL